MKRKDNKGRVKRGVAIYVFLDEEFGEAHKRAGAPKPLTTPEGEFEGRFVEILLMFNKYDDSRKKIDERRCKTVHNVNIPSS